MTDPISAEPEPVAQPTAQPDVPRAPAASETIETGTVRVRRAPKLGSFLLAGLGFGVILALIATFAFPSTPDFATSQIFGFLLLIGAVVGVALGAVVALIVGRVLEGRSREVSAERASTPPPPEP